MLYGEERGEGTRGSCKCHFFGSYNVSFELFRSIQISLKSRKKMYITFALVLIPNCITRALPIVILIKIVSHQKLAGWFRTRTLKKVL